MRVSACITVFMLFLILIVCSCPLKGQGLSFLRVDGQRVVNVKNDEVLLGGFNLGNWLLVEPWMLKLSIDGIQTGRDIFDLFEKRFGEEKAMSIYMTYVENYITEQDIRYLSGLGVNFIRVPFWYRAVFDLKYTRKEMHYLDKVIGWCRKYGIYVLLDMHSAPGGQTTDIGILGERLRNELWTKEENIQLLIQMWQKIAGRYKDESIVAGYDILNEASGAPGYETMIQVYDRIYRAIRVIDRKHIIVIEDGLKGISRLPRPSDMGWNNVLYSFHFYPTFGGPDNMEEIKAASQVFLPSVRAAADFFNMPFHVGECNSMSMAKGGVEYLDRYIRIFREYGWPWNIWSYKRIDDNDEDRWGLVGRLKEWPVPDLNTMTFEEARDLFKSFNSSQVGSNPVYEAMIRAYFKDLKDFKRPDYLLPDKLVLVPQNGYLIRAKSYDGLRIEWNRKKANYGFWNKGDSVLWKINIKKAGMYKVVLDYATDAPEARLSLILDHYRYKELVLPRTRAGWEDYRKNVEGYLSLEPGEHFLKITGKSPDNGIMNLRCVELVYEGKDIPAGQASLRLSPGSDEEIVLTPCDVTRINRKKSLSVEWQNNPPNFGYMSGWESFEWDICLLNESDYALAFNFSTPQQGIIFEIYVNGGIFKSVKAPSTGDWHNYLLNEPGKVKLRKGKNTIKFVALSGYDENTGNFRDVRLKKK
ncbi:MAG: cellulase family glycosylhydrolase [bacterium]|nr:cellulase family glycosylhydrolase [bacterium]